MDPDEFLRAYGPEAFRRVLDNAIGIGEMMWRKALTNMSDLSKKDVTQPHVRAQIEQELFDACARMQDATMRRHFEVFYRDKLIRYFGTCRTLPHHAVTVLPPTMARKPRGGAAASALARKDYGKVVELTPLLAAGAAQRRIEEQSPIIEHPLRKEPAA